LKNGVAVNNELSNELHYEFAFVRKFSNDINLPPTAAGTFTHAIHKMTLNISDRLQHIIQLLLLKFVGGVVSTLYQTYIAH
jgi:hypothetical protein